VAVSASLNKRGHTVVRLDTADQDFTESVRSVDRAFLAIAGQWAEDGKLQGFLETLGVPYTGSGVLASAIAMHKPTAKKIVGASGVRVLPHVLVLESDSPDEVVARCRSELQLPVILKPSSEGGSIGIKVFHDFDALQATLTDRARRDERFIEPFVKGAPVTCGVLYRDGRLSALPPLETLPTTAEFYDYASKRDPAGHRYRCPANIPDPLLAGVMKAAVTAHQSVRCTTYSRCDFLVTPDGEIFWLETNTLPGLSRGGNLATMADSAGIAYDELIDTILSNAYRSEYRP
jgi:D-alanine-D-alanine ligase